LPRPIRPELHPNFVPYVSGLQRELPPQFVQYVAGLQQESNNRSWFDIDNEEQYGPSLSTAVSGSGYKRVGNSVIGPENPGEGPPLNPFLTRQSELIGELNILLREDLRNLDLPLRTPSNDVNGAQVIDNFRRTPNTAFPPHGTFDTIMAPDPRRASYNKRRSFAFVPYLEETYRVPHTYDTPLPPKPVFVPDVGRYKMYNTLPPGQPPVGDIVYEDILPAHGRRRFYNDLPVGHDVSLVDEDVPLDREESTSPMPRIPFYKQMPPYFEKKINEQIPDSQYKWTDHANLGDAVAHADDLMPPP